MIFEAQKAALVVAAASGHNPAIGTLTVWLFYAAFCFVEAAIETLIFGEHFLHWLDPVFALLFMAFAGGVVWACAKAQLAGGE